MFSDNLNKLFGDLRSALNDRDFFRLHNISKKIIKIDRMYYENVVVEYISTQMSAQGDSMDQNTRIRNDHFKTWVRNEINSSNDQRKEEIVYFFKQLLLDQEYEHILIFSEGIYSIKIKEEAIIFPSSARFINKKMRGYDKYYTLSQESQDALWVVLDECNLI